MRLFMTSLALAVVLAMAGCGQKGDLYREDAGGPGGVEENEDNDEEK